MTDEVAVPGAHSSSFIAAVFALVARGYTVEVRSACRASYHATIRNHLDAVVGDLEYRDPSDEPEEYAQGLTYANHGGDEMGRVFQIVLAFCS